MLFRSEFFEGYLLQRPNLEVLVTDYDIDLSELNMAELTYRRHMVYKSLHRVTDGSDVGKTEFNTQQKELFHLKFYYTKCIYFLFVSHTINTTPKLTS